ncbi:hypothetical protein PBAL39_13407 [Pedobacter sp. BAL39]|uniref:tail fiber domain-containing protein n=1 Tax=Pedobacter sp. BAL39 TaxID=391596 RepID=UPI0001559963|nr:tail fiber domain-containing protein [Pedobacter sp. BAL39]EDM35232.1 hypothetical protein PBAL39_13407 [Pedobacter sp. BAL39]
MNKLITALLLLISSATFAQVSVINPDSIRLGTPNGTGSVGLYGKLFLKNILEGNPKDSILVRGADGHIRFVKQSRFGLGAVTLVSSANTDIEVFTGTTTPVLKLNAGSGPNQIVKRDGNGFIDGVIRNNTISTPQVANFSLKGYGYFINPETNFSMTLDAAALVGRGTNFISSFSPSSISVSNTLSTESLTMQARSLFFDGIGKTIELTPNFSAQATGLIRVTMPTVTGTLALRSELPRNYVTSNSDQDTLWGYKVWRSPQTVTAQVTATSFVQSSSRKLKENIIPFTTNALAKINEIDVVSFSYKNDDRSLKKVGFIAEDTDPLFSTVDHNTMDIGTTLGVALKAIQELSAEVEALKAELAKYKKVKTTKK